MFTTRDKMATRNKRIRAFRVPSGLVYLDEDLQLPVERFFQDGEDDSVLFLDKNLTIAVEMHDVTGEPTKHTSASVSTNDGSVTASTSQSQVASTAIAVHDSWTRDETLCLINEMQLFLGEEEHLPSSLYELNTRIRRGRGHQKSLFTDAAMKLTETFGIEFPVKQVARKWQTLCDGFKNAIDNNNSTGKGRSRFMFFVEMNCLLGGRADINFVVTANSKKVTVHRPESVKPVQSKSPVGDMNEDNASDTEDGDIVTPIAVTRGKGVLTSTAASRGKDKQARPVTQRKRRGGDDDAILEYLRKSDEKIIARENAILEEMKQFHKSLSDAMGKIAKKF